MSSKGKAQVILMFVWLTFGLIDIGPGLVTSKNIVHLLAVKCLALHDL